MFASSFSFLSSCLSILCLLMPFFLYFSSLSPNVNLSFLLFPFSYFVSFFTFLSLTVNLSSSFWLCFFFYFLFCSAFFFSLLIYPCLLSVTFYYFDSFSAFSLTVNLVLPFSIFFLVQVFLLQIIDIFHLPVSFFYSFFIFPTVYLSFSFCRCLFYIFFPFNLSFLMLIYLSLCFIFDILVFVQLCLSLLIYHSFFYDFSILFLLQIFLAPLIFHLFIVLSFSVFFFLFDIFFYR